MTVRLFTSRFNYGTHTINANRLTFVKLCMKTTPFEATPFGKVKKVKLSLCFN